MGYTVEEIAELLEHEMSSAFEVRDEQSLKRCVQLIAKNTVGRHEYERDNTGIRAEIRQLSVNIEHISESIRQGFAETHRRFEQVDKRFETMQHNMDKRFSNMFTFMTIGFSLLTIIAVLFKFLM